MSRRKGVFTRLSDRIGDWDTAKTRQAQTTPPGARRELLQLQLGLYRTAIVFAACLAIVAVVASVVGGAFLMMLEPLVALPVLLLAAVVILGRVRT